MHYHARDMAVVRAQRRRRFRSCWRRRRRRSKPKSMRGAAATAGCICRSASAASICRASRRSICKREGPPRGRFIAPRLAEAVKIALERGEQALLFLNRRGYAPLTLCRACGYPPRLPELRRLAGRSPLPAAAGLPSLRLLDAAAGRMPEMRGEGQLRCRSVPASSGWQRRSRSCFPDARMLVLSSDLVESVERLREELDDVAEGRFDIIIGTQLVAKGHHFPKLNLVGIVDADLGLAQWRSARGRAHLPAAASGGRAAPAARQGQRLRLPADASARASGDARADLAATARRSTTPRSRCARRPAIRRSAGSRA